MSENAGYFRWVLLVCASPCSTVTGLSIAAAIGILFAVYALLFCPVLGLGEIEKGEKGVRSHCSVRGEKKRVRPFDLIRPDPFFSASS